MTDVPSVLRDVNDPASRIARMTAAEGKKAILDGVVTKGMIPKLEESFAAIALGVRAVHIVGKLAAGTHHVHLMLLVDFRSRVAVYWNWSWAFFTYGRGARLLTSNPAARRTVAEAGAHAGPAG